MSAVPDQIARSSTLPEASTSKTNPETTVSSDFSSRPKLGIRLFTKSTTKVKRSSAASLFPPLSIKPIDTNAAAGFTADYESRSQGQKAGQQQDEAEIVLPSPSKCDRSLSSQNNPSGQQTDLLATSRPIEKEVTKKTAGVDEGVISRYGSSKKKPSTNNNINDNFVRLNMKNNAGACRGARNKSNKYSKERRSWSFQSGAPSSERNNDMHDFKSNNNSSNSKSNAASYVSKMSGLDPLDEFVDGTFHSCHSKPDKRKINESSTIAGIVSIVSAPMCARHQRPCKLIKVKKTTSGNKGREFYACSMPRGEQCDHFQWADDTIEAARHIIDKNTSYSSFITRQVAAYVDRFRTLTVPELKVETSRRGLNNKGKKHQLLTRLAIWTRDEIVKCSPEFENEETETNQAIELEGELIDDDSSSCSQNSSEDELELFDEGEESEEESCSDGHDEEFCAGKRKDSSTIRSAVIKESHAIQASCLSTSLRDIFGHTSFRTGQEWAIQRCLDEKTSLLVAPTGFGKSLCYALPAALMDGVCIVVSPLISLIQDQLRSLPPRIPAATLSGSVSASKTAAILDDIVRKRLKILFVSPERLTSPAFRRLFNLTWNKETNTKERRFPEISLLCIDEAHCISQWAHNFRPCFLRFKGFLKIMKPKSVLAITATAGPRVIADIGETLGMHKSESCSTEMPENGTYIQSESIKIIRTGRDNIDVMGTFMTNQEERLAVVAGILTPCGTAQYDKKQPYAGKLAEGSVIVYVWRQKDTEVVAESLIASGVSGGVVMYHGGMDANARAKSQNKFMRGKARICVATVAFGLGIDKADIVGIVHLYLSNSPEHYIQEIGRAGRDGRSATAIALPLLEEVPIRHSLVFSNLVAKSQIRSLLTIIKRMVESTAKAAGIENSGSGRTLHIPLPVQSAVRACDCKPETIETFLSLIERIGGENPLVQIEGYNYDNAVIALKKRTLKKLAETEPVAVSIQSISQCLDSPLMEAGLESDKTQKEMIPASFQRHFLAYSKGSHSFSISQCANRLGPTAEPRHVFATLRRLQSSNELEFVLDTTEMGRVFHLKISEVGFNIFSGDAYSKMEDDLCETIFESFSSSGHSGASKVLDMHYILDQVARSSSIGVDVNEEASSSNRSPSLVRFQQLTKNYFGQGLEVERLAVQELLPASFSTIREKELKIDALTLLRDLPPLFQENKTKSVPEFLELGDQSVADYTTLAITKFLHGMDTPRTPSFTFRQYPLFGKWKTVDFRMIHDAIGRIIEGKI
eukprot:jgi/Psemu1/190921/e_gw1.107.107.1